MGEFFDRITDFLQRDGWPVQAESVRTVLRMGFAGQNGNWNCYLDVNEDRGMAVFYSRCPLTAPDHRIAEMAEFLARANYGLRFGNFEFDPDDGDIRYKTTIEFDEEPPGDRVLAGFFHTNVVMMDMYLPGVAAVAFGEMDPLEAIETIEGPRRTFYEGMASDELPEAIRRRSNLN